MAASQKKIIFCLFDNKDFKPFFVDSGQGPADLILGNFFSQTFSGSKKTPNNLIKNFWAKGSDVYIHVLHEIVDDKDETNLLKYWQKQFKSKEKHSPLGPKFSEGLKKRFNY